MESEDEEMVKTNERILSECYELYTGKNGLSAIGKEFNLEILPPRKQVVVLLLGNHSAGKSSFINWYVGENVQKVGVAVETQGFTFVRHGRRRETLLAEAALMSMRQFQELETIEGLTDFLKMQVSPSQQRKFQLVTLIDSPGLVDGGSKYPFDVEKTLLTLGKSVDLIFVFFDPIGQALCKRTLAVVHQLMEIRKDGMIFLLSKVDEAGHFGDRQKVIVQIVQELSTCSNFNRQGFEIKSIHIPGLERGKDSFNQIEELSEEIDKAVSFTVQRTLNRLGHDCALLEKAILQNDQNNKMRCTLPVIGSLALTLSSAALILINSNLQLHQFFFLVISFSIFAHYSKLLTLFNISARFKKRNLGTQIRNARLKHLSLYQELLNSISPCSVVRPKQKSSVRIKTKF